MQLDSTHKTILILGASGMLGNAAYRFFAQSPGWTTVGTLRSPSLSERLPQTETARLVTGIDIYDFTRLVRLFSDVRPAIVLNAIGVIKQLAAAKDTLPSIEINSLWPHRLATLCGAAGARLVHVSTDCVFEGTRGMYRENDRPDATDLYGRTKLLGEVDYSHAVTLRTSIVGHEMASSVSLIDWFLSQPGPRVRGFRKAIYSGFPTVELSRIIRDVVFPRQNLRGLWHVASAPICKYELLKLVARAYGKEIAIDPDDSVVIDRSLDGSRFSKATGYVAPPWEELVCLMHRSR